MKQYVSDCAAFTVSFQHLYLCGAGAYSYLFACLLYHYQL